LGNFDVTHNTTFGMLAMVEAQKDGFYIILVDTEKKFSLDRFEKMGGNPKEVLCVFPDNLEEGFVGVEETVNVVLHEDPGAKILILYDSLGGTPSRAETEVEADQTIQLATAAKVIKRWLRTFVQKIAKNNICMIFINQVYANIGSHGYSNSGGEGAEFFASVIMQLFRTGNYMCQVQGKKMLAGIDSIAKITKNHLLQGESAPKEVKFRVKAYTIESLEKE
jgi:RecA/RadA recombinase